MATTGASDYLAKARLGWYRGDTHPAAPSNIYLTLLTAVANGVNASGTEMTGTGYTRVAVPSDHTHLTAPSQPGGAGTAWQISNVNAISFGVAASDWTGPAVGYAWYDASSGGNMLDFGTFTSTAIVTGLIVQVPAGSAILTDR